MVSWFGKEKEKRIFKERNGLEEYRNSVDDALLRWEERVHVMRQMGCLEVGKLGRVVCETTSVVCSRVLMGMQLHPERCF